MQKECPSLSGFRRCSVPTNSFPNLPQPAWGPFPWYSLCLLEGENRERIFPLPSLVPAIPKAVQCYDSSTFYLLQRFSMATQRPLSSHLAGFQDHQRSIQKKKKKSGLSEGSWFPFGSAVILKFLCYDVAFISGSSVDFSTTFTSTSHGPQLYSNQGRRTRNSYGRNLGLKMHLSLSWHCEKATAE